MVTKSALFFESNDLTSGVSNRGNSSNLCIRLPQMKSIIPAAIITKPRILLFESRSLLVARSCWITDGSIGVFILVKRTMSAGTPTSGGEVDHWVGLCGQEKSSKQGGWYGLLCCDLLSIAFCEASEP